MDASYGSASQRRSVGGIQKSTTPQKQSYTVYPPCVVLSLREIIARSAITDNSNNAAEDIIQDEDVVTDINDEKIITKLTDPEGKRLHCLSRASATIAWALESGFFKVGLFVGEYPIVVIISIMIMCGLCGLGLKTFHETQEQDKLWVPQTSRLILEKAWVQETFPQQTRFVSLMAIQKGGNILTPISLNALMDYYVESLKLQVNGKKFSDMCMRSGPFCYVSSLLELWLYNATMIRSLTASDIISMVNKTKVSPISGVDVITLLGGRFSYSKDGLVIAAEATHVMWVLKNNSDAAAFEKLMIDRSLKGHPNISNVYIYATRSFDDEGYGAINSDLKLLAAGFSIVFLFIMLSLGKFNLLEQKIYVSLAGMVCVGLAILVAYGLSTALEVMYSPIQSIMPFLLLGIGVDDMFVIVETWKNLSPEEGKLDVPNKLAAALSRAGVSITVTSLTDVVAFGISATTSIPALSSFCIYAAIGIFALYILVSTVFAAVLALDERRRKAGRDACLCYKLDESYTPSKCGSGRSFLQLFFENWYGPLITRLPVKIFIIILAFALAGMGLWRFILMKQNFDLTNYIPSTSYAYSYARTKQEYFDRQGVDTAIYCGVQVAIADIADLSRNKTNMQNGGWFETLKFQVSVGLKGGGLNYFETRDKLQAMHARITDSPFIQSGTINSWFATFSHMVHQSGQNITSEADYNKKLFMFVQTPLGRRFASFVKLNSTVEPVSIVASYITVRHARQPDSQHDVMSMDNLRHIIDSSSLPKFHGQKMPEYMCFTYCIDYMSFETNKVLQDELYRNLGLSAVAVFLVTLVLIANLWTSLLVFLCVILTMIDMGGCLEMWDVTIDTASSILLTLSVGLAVDYSSHIGHTFMTISGTRNNRVLVTLKTIGPAVFNGGFSTFLAFLLLVNSTSYGFQLFFKVFFSVVLFGLFHGLAFLPVVLSMIGAKSYKHSDEIPDNAVLLANKSDEENQLSEQTSEHITHQGCNQTSKQDLSGPTGAWGLSIFGKSSSRDHLPGVTDVTVQPCISVISRSNVHCAYSSSVYVNQGFDSTE